MQSSMKGYCTNCRVCATVKPAFRKPPLKPFLVDSPMSLIAVDYVGPLPTSHGASYMLVIIDCFSRYPEVFPVHDMSASTLIRCFRQFFSRYGFPDAVLSDRGSQLMSTEFIEYLARFNIAKKSTTAYHPSSNGLCERFNGTIQKIVKCLLTEKNLPNSAWSDVLPSALFAYRNSIHSTTGFKPTDLWFSFKVRDTMPRSDAPSVSNFNKAASNIAMNRNTRCNRVKGHVQSFSKGDEVLVKNHRKVKFDLPGIYGTVVKQIDSHVAEVDLGNRTVKVSTSQISPLPPDVPPASILRRSDRLKSKPRYLNEYVT